ncbi:MAG: hypothetical protein J0L53_10485 [Spirochaetes bacterium]|nr:hypothetical protein [Spirochaetota bacterium]
MIGSDQLIEKLLQTLSVFEDIQLRLDPPRFAEYQSRVKAIPDFTQLADNLRAIELPEAQAFAQRQLLKAAAQVAKGKETFLAADQSRVGLMSAFRSLRFFCRAYEALYPLAPFYKNIEDFFSAAGKDPAEKPKPAAADGIPRGIMDFGNDRNARGGYTLYVPEYYSPETEWPLIVALHGGSGHGADFFWSWLKTARARGAILLAPSSLENTWSMHIPTADGRAMLKMVNTTIGNYKIDPQRMLITGISDGGTFSLMLTASAMNIFSHTAAVACAGHAFTQQAKQFAQKKIYLVHGGRDWMFPVAPVRTAAATLQAAGADIIYREIADLSHNYPGDENARIMDWFLA